MRNNNVPIIIFHEGNQEYLKVCIEHAKRFNERVILLGDESNRKINVEWYDNSEFEKESRWQEFLQYFENYSFYDDKFAKQIFKRLFVIEQFVKIKEINKFALLDSDILIYIDFSSMDYVRQYDVGCLTLDQKYDDYRWITNIGISFFSDKAIEEFVDFCIKEYKYHKEELLKKWEWQKKTNTPGGIGEMPLAYLWTRSTDMKVLNLAKPVLNYGIYENAANTSGNYYPDEYKMNHFLRIKKVKFIDGQPYFIKKKSQELQKVDGLHFSTVTKRFMKSYSLHERPLLMDYIIELIMKIKRRIKC
ncbi:MAG: hypothetical protein ACI4F4_03110 [Lachnospiraceae bacterium]